MNRAFVATPIAVLLFAFAAAPGFAQQRLSREEKEILHKLETTPLTLEFQEAPFDEVIEYLRMALQANLVVDPAIYQDRTPEELRITLKVRQLPAKNVLDLILDIHGLDHIFKNGVLMISTKEARKLKPYTIVYDIRDLTFEIRDFPGPDISLSAADASSGGSFGAVFDDQPENEVLTLDAIEDLIKENVGIGTWEDGSTSIRHVGGLLMVRQSDEVHREVEQLLGMLRQYK